MFVFLILLTSVASAQYGIEGFVNDYADVLTQEQELEIKNILEEMYDSGVAEYAIVTIPSLEGKDITGFAYELAEGNLGDEKKNNGMLLLIAVEDRRYRFEIGRGLEPVIPDIIAGRIGREYIVPNFKEENYYLGIKEASLAVRAVLFENVESEYYVDEEEFDIVTILPILIMMVIFLIMMIFAIKQSMKDFKEIEKAKGKDKSD